MELLSLRYNRRDMIKLSLASGTISALPAPLAARIKYGAPRRSPWIKRNRTLKIGFLWSLTGHLSVIEKPSRDIGLFWIDKINREGGVAGLQIEPVVFDARSDMKTYRQGILDLILKENVIATFGGYISASRRAVMPLVTKYNGLFYYPTCYSGRECWQHIICTGPIANQHSYDLIPYMTRTFGPRALFVGSNYIWPKESNRNAVRWLTDAGGTRVAEHYIPLGSDDFGPVFETIQRLKPDWIFSTVIGDSDIYFRRAYSAAGLTPDQLPTASLTTSEMEVKIMGTEFGEGHILSAPYFQSLDTPANQSFVNAFLASYHGKSGVTHFNIEETYLSFVYFKKAVERLVAAEGEDAISPPLIRMYSRDLAIGDDESPEGAVHLDPDNLNSWLRPRIGRFNANGQIDLLFDRGEKIPPKPFLLYPQRGRCRIDGLHLPSGKIVEAAS